MSSIAALQQENVIESSGSSGLKGVNTTKHRADNGLKSLSTKKQLGIKSTMRPALGDVKNVSDNIRTSTCDSNNLKKGGSQLSSKNLEKSQKTKGDEKTGVKTDVDPIEFCSLEPVDDPNTWSLDPEECLSRLPASCFSLSRLMGSRRHERSCEELKEYVRTIELELNGGLGNGVEDAAFDDDYLDRMLQLL